MYRDAILLHTEMPFEHTIAGPERIDGPVTTDGGKLFDSPQAHQQTRAHRTRETKPAKAVGCFRPGAGRPQSRGSWRYHEHDWIRGGDYGFEAPGETHTLIVDGVEEMITLLNNSGCLYYVDEHGNNTRFVDVFTKIDMCRKHYINAGLGLD